MVTSNFFTDSQNQFDESQKKLTALWEESQKQLLESQKKLIYTWIDTLRGGTAQVNYSENIEKTLNFQRELINSSLNAQQATVNLAIETQKQFWENYLQASQKVADETKKQ